MHSNLFNLRKNNREGGEGGKRKNPGDWYYIGRGAGKNVSLAPSPAFPTTVPHPKIA